MAVNLLFIITVLFSGLLNAWEVDNFTHRSDVFSETEKVIKSNTLELDKKTDRYLKKALAYTNSHTELGCESDAAKILLTKRLHADIAGGVLSGTMQTWLGQTREVKTYKSERNIYRTRTYFPDPSFNLGGVMIGTDKVDHFLDQGYELYKLIEGQLHQGKSFSEIDLTDVHKKNQEWENGFYGVNSSGIKSYGDISANLEGLVFWSALFYGPEPRIKCNKKSKKFYITNKMDWVSYVNDSWDEGVNCSLYKKSSLKYEGRGSINYSIRLSRAGKSANAFVSDKYGTSCPVDKEKCKVLAKRVCAEYAISPLCLDNTPKKKIETQCSLEALFQETKIRNPELRNKTKNKTKYTIGIL